MRKYFILLLFTVSTIFPFNEGFAQTERTYDMHSISSQELFQYVKELSSEKYGGRLTGTAGYDSAAHWMARKFEQWKINPLGDNGTYFQHFDIPYTLVEKEGRVTLHVPVEDGMLYKHYDYVKEYMPGSTSDSGMVTGEVVYVGYGITAPELGYDDYKDVDVQGKIVLMEREVPLNARQDQEKFIKWAPYSYHQYKLKNAVEHGATGMLYNYGPIANPNNDFRKGFIYSQVGDSVVNDLFAGTGRSHKETVEHIKTKLKPRSFNTGKKATIVNHTSHFPDGNGSNVIGLIEGADPELKDEVIIVSAHLDHLGYCHELIPGANDNASGVAVMLGVAKALKKNDIRLKRSVMFLAFGAEEQGIVGSKIYLERPGFPVDKTVALLNMDGVGVGDKLGAVAGKNFPELFEVVSQVNDNYIHRKIRPSEYLNITRPRLDAARFMSAGIPVLSFYAHGRESVYHRPGDEVDIITPEIMEDLAQLMYLTVINLSNK